MIVSFILYNAPVCNEILKDPIFPYDLNWRVNLYIYTLSADNFQYRSVNSLCQDHQKASTCFSGVLWYLFRTHHGRFFPSIPEVGRHVVMNCNMWRTDKKTQSNTLKANFASEFMATWTLWHVSVPFKLLKWWLILLPSS